MPLVQADLIFEQEGYGWSEGYVKSGVSTDLSTYMPGVQLLGQKRILVSGAQTRMPYVRASIIGVARDVYVAGTSLSGTTGRDSDVCHVSLTHNMHNVDYSKNSQIFVRGVWDGMITVGGVFTPDGTYLGVINNWKAEITAGGWGWLGTTSTTTALIDTVTQNTNGTVTIECKTNIFPDPWPTFANIRISGVEGAYQVNGPRIVVPGSRTTFTTKKRLAIFPYTNGGQVRFNVLGFIQQAATNFRKVGRRPCGAPLYLTPGRQAA